MGTRGQARILEAEGVDKIAPLGLKLNLPLVPSRCSRAEKLVERVRINIDEIAERRKKF